MTEQGRQRRHACRSALATAGLLALIFALRAVHPGQPIVENYVGRQVPTAMVARNLDRGSGFLRPRLDTGPEPNLFLVEPPLYALAVVAGHRLTGLDWGPSGRLVSALALTLGGWGLYGLAARREGRRVALLALAAFAFLPVTIRYGRSVQPDALMLGTMLAALRCWDEREAGGAVGWLLLGWPLLAAGLALKVVAAYLLIPLCACILRTRRPWKVALVVAALGPALLWYLHAGALIAAGEGSRASAENGAIWLRVLVPTALFRSETWAHVARFFLVRAFTPIGLALAAWGFVRGCGDRLWPVWGGAALATLALLAAKLHHEYYWLALAPVMAVGIGLALSRLLDRDRLMAILVGVGLASLMLAQSWSTWRTPADWVALPEAVRVVREHVPPDARLVAPEALLFLADRRGCRLEVDPNAARRAAGEWGATLSSADPLALIEFYRGRGARFVADVGPDDPARRALHEAIRSRYNVLVDRPGVLLAALTDPGEVRPR